MEITPLGGVDMEDELAKLSADDQNAIRQQRDVSGMNERVLRKLRAHKGDPAELLERYDAFSDRLLSDDEFYAQARREDDAALLGDIEALLAGREPVDLTSDEQRALVDYRLRHGLSHASGVRRQRDGKYVVDLQDTAVTDDEVRARMAEEGTDADSDDDFDDADEGDDDDEAQLVRPDGTKQSYPSMLLLPEENALLDQMELEDDAIADAVEAEEEFQTREKRSRIKGFMRRKLRDELDGTQRRT